MELDLSTAETAVALEVSAEPEVFGTRPDTGRPHSINLYGSARDGGSPASVRGLEVLLGLGVGAALMYYLDPEAGARRRTLLRERLLEAATAGPDVFDGAAREVSPGARALSVDGLPEPETSAAGCESRRSSEAQLVASAIGSALTFIGGRRRDTVGAVVGVLGSMLLTRGVTRGQRVASGSRVGQ